MIVDLDRERFERELWEWANELEDGELAVLLADLHGTMKNNDRINRGEQGGTAHV